LTEKNNLREKEVTLDFDPSVIRDAQLAFIGKVSSQWSRGDCPKNLTEARASDRASASVSIDAPYRAGLSGLKVGMKIWLVLWFDRSRRDIIVQSPHHANEAKGAFSLRSPIRPNPISIQAVTITHMDFETGKLCIDTTDAFDATPVLDIKPWREAIDVPPPSRLSDNY